MMMPIFPRTRPHADGRLDCKKVRDAKTIQRKSKPTYPVTRRELTKLSFSHTPTRLARSDVNVDESPGDPR